MSTEVTLVHEDANPSTYTTSNPATITQLKSQGYREVDADEDPGTGYGALKLGQLREEVRRRNADRTEETQVAVDGRSHADFVAALEADDAAQADNGGEE